MSLIISRAFAEGFVCILKIRLRLTCYTLNLFFISQKKKNEFKTNIRPIRAELQRPNVSQIAVHFL